MDQLIVGIVHLLVLLHLLVLVFGEADNVLKAIAKLPPSNKSLR
jgi:hypothetical protein